MLWRINLKPGSEQGVDAAAFCIERGVVGIGWRVDPAPSDRHDYWARARQRYHAAGKRSWAAAATHRPTERLLADWRSRDFDAAAGTLNEGLKRIAPLFQPIYDAMCERNGLSKLFQADETRWKVFEVVDGKTGHTWWLWVFLGADTTVYILDMTRSHDVPEAHLGEAEGTMVVDRFSA